MQQQQHILTRQIACETMQLPDEPTEEDIIYAAYLEKKGFKKPAAEKKKKSLYLIFDMEKDKFKPWPTFLCNTVPNFEGENMLVGAHDLIIKSTHYADTIEANNFGPSDSIMESIFEYVDNLEKYRDDIIDFEFNLPRTDGLTKDNMLYNINHALKRIKKIYNKWKEDYPTYMNCWSL